MPDFTQSARGLEPPTVVDHVLLPVADLEDGARSMYEGFGLKGIPGGRHPGVGPAKVIVPLGLQYIEVVAIVGRDEAASSRLGGRVGRALNGGKKFVAWALRRRDLDAVRARLQGAGWQLPAIVEGSRTRPDGQILRWRTQDIDAGTEPSAIPFVIEWRIPDGLHPGEVESSHRTGPAALRRVVVGARDPRSVRDGLQTLRGDSDLYAVREGPVDGVLKVVLETGAGELVTE